MRLLRNLAVLAMVSIAVGMEALQIPQPGTTPGQTAAPANTAPPQIATVRDQWVTYLQAKNIEALMALYSKDAMFLDSTGQRLVGQPAIRNLCRQVMANFNANLTLYSIRSVASGDLAYESGNYLETLTQTSSGASQTLHGSYIMVFKQQPDGAWSIFEQMWTEAPPSSAVEQKPR